MHHNIHPRLSPRRLTQSPPQPIGTMGVTKVRFFCHHLENKSSCVLFWGNRCSPGCDFVVVNYDMTMRGLWMYVFPPPSHTMQLNPSIDSYLIHAHIWWFLSHLISSYSTIVLFSPHTPLKNGFSHVPFFLMV
jgi:hypothetical protein